ncbi:flavin reductase family protein [Oceaniglobus roseus]|uniref:flavin reductase family protein n=1 Tax=Oceaniglobus roseus TaxID=1737570 RepID=UPI000C7F02D8|nr:flavin reductase family protein [Kandeliimicrobium roseum]
MSGGGEEFVPGPDTARAFRDALGQFATGVTVVTTQSPVGPLGITANSFASVSLDPPLVLWSPARASRRFDAFVEAEHFAIHVMSSEQAHLSDGFVRDGLRFDHLDWIEGADGTPLIEGCLARFECRRHAVHDGGDHAIVLGRVLRVSTGVGTPLVFAAGQYRALAR